MLTAGCNSSASDEGGPLASLLAELPASPLVEYEDFVHIQLVDWVLFTEIAGIEPRPASGNEDEFYNWIKGLLEGEVHGVFDMADQGTLVPSFAELDRQNLSVDVFGFSPLTADRYATIFVGYDEPSVAVLKGPADLPEGLEDLGDGVRGLGEGEELIPNVEAATRLNNLGRPLRFGQRADWIIVASTKRLVQDWLEELPRVDSDPQYADVVAALDAKGAAAGFIVTEDFASETQQGATDGRFVTVGFGISKSGDRLAYTVAYYFETADAATAALDGLRAAWQGPTEVGLVLSNYITVESIEVSGSVVAVHMTVSDEGRSLPANMFAFRGLWEVAAFSHN